MIGIGIIGAGYWGPKHVRNFSEVPGARATMVADLDERRLATIQSQHPGIRTTTNYLDLLNSPDVDGVVIATPVCTHAQLAREALLANKHVLVEKPLAATSSEAEELLRIAHEQHRVLMVGHTFLYNPAVRALRELVQSGNLGEIFYVYCQRLNLGLFQRDINVIWDLAPHDVSILIYVLGIDPIAVGATGTAYVRPGIEDVAYVQLAFPDRVHAAVHVSWLDPNKVRRITVVGSKKMATPTATATATATAISGANPIISENQQPGTDAWLLPNNGFQLADDTANQIKGFGSATSVNQGGSIDLKVTVNPAQTFTISFYRLGWYGGLGGRLLLQTAPLNGIQQPQCPTTDASTLLLACNWSSSYTLTVPASWTDGVYLAVLSSSQGFQNYVPFVVRNDARSASLLYQQPVNTYQAYNSWGGKSLYTFNSTNNVRAYKVSFDRPYDGEGSVDYFGWEVYTVRWLEQQGYDVTYSTDVDAEIRPNRLRGVKGVIIPGHSEYWTQGMYDAAQSARDAGVNLGFLGSNAIYWQARYESANRVLVCYKTNEPPSPSDPITASNPALTTTQWRLGPVNRPEQPLVGVQFTSQTGAGWDATVPYVVTNSGNWVYAGSGFSDGSSVAGLTGYEADRLFQQFPRPASQAQTATLLANSPFTGDYHNASIYQAMSGAWVFSTGSQAWVWGLNRSGYTSTGIQQTLTNVLDRFLTNVPVAVTPTPVPTPAPSAYRTAILADSPVAYWRLGESSGTVASDQREAHRGTYAYDPLLGQPGALSGDPATSAAFNGTTQYVQAPTDGSVNTPQFSFEVWARPTSSDTNYHGVLTSRSYPLGWNLYLGGSGAWEFWLNSGSGMVSVAGGTNTVNAWHHIVGTFDGTTARLYVNGTAVASAAVAGFSPQVGSPFEMAQGESSSGLYFPGQLQDVAVYATALGAPQVQHHYSVGTTGQ